MTQHEIIQRAAEIINADARRAFLDEACAGDLPLRQRIEQLLGAGGPENAALPQGEGFAATADLSKIPADVEPLIESTASAVANSVADLHIGSYKVLKQIGEGGFGVVYMAEQHTPVRRRVAVKVLKLGMDTQSVIARFEAERQALAMMDHPHIAKVFDAGATATGRPYFVMELVHGVKITDYVAEHQMSVAERLGLFMQTCHAIQHAHQRGIIHRDIKPSNVLVTSHDGVAVPKVIDFGVAKAIEQQLTDNEVFTAFEQLIGTPAYMSPEQTGLSALDLDTRSDVYSLGVLLYELLTDRTPFDPKMLAKSGIDELRRIIREQDPQLPSLRLSTLPGETLSKVAARRRLDDSRVVRSIRGDLDWIVMKALEKDRDRRYESASALADDVGRHLTHEPVLARPPSTWYRFQKLAQRNKFLFGAVTAVSLAIVVGFAVSTYLFLRESVARQRAVDAEQEQSRLLVRERVARQRAVDAEKEQSRLLGIAKTSETIAKKNEAIAVVEAKKSQKIAEFLQQMLEGAGPSAALGRDTKMLRDVLNRTAQRVGVDLADQPEVEAQMRSILGRVYEDLGEFGKAEELHRGAVAIRRRLHQPPHIDLAEAIYGLSRTLSNANQFDEGEKLMRESLAMYKQVLGDEHRRVADALNILTNHVQRQGRLDEAEALNRQALAIFEKLYHSQHISIGRTLKNLGDILLERGNLAEAETLQRRSVVIHRAARGELDPELVTRLDALAHVLAIRGNLVDAEAARREALAICRKTLSPEQPRLAISMQNLARLLLQRKKPAEAEALFREALTLRQTAAPTDPRQWERELGNLADIYLATNRYDEAEQLYTTALARIPDSALVLRWRGMLRARYMRVAEAISDFTQAVELRPVEHDNSYRLAALLAQDKDVTAYQRIVEQMLARFGPSKDPFMMERTVKSCLLLPSIELDWKSLNTLADAIAAADDQQRFLQFAKALAEYRQGQYQPAIKRLEKICAASKGEYYYVDVQAQAVLAMSRHQLGEPEAARTALAESRSLAEKHLPPFHGSDLGEGHQDGYIARVLLREAGELVEP